MARYPHRDETTPPSLAGIMAGVRYALSRRDLLGTYLVDIAAMLLAIPVVLFPALAEDVFRHPELLGLLYTSETVGALLADRHERVDERVHHHGRAIVVAAAFYGGFIALAGIAPGIWWCMGAFAPGRRGRHDLGGLPQHGVEPDDPGVDARPAGRHRDAVLLPRPARRAGPRRLRRGRLVGARPRSPAAVSPASPASSPPPPGSRDFWGYDSRTDEHAVAERARRAEG